METFYSKRGEFFLGDKVYQLLLAIEVMLIDFSFCKSSFFVFMGDRRLGVLYISIGGTSFESMSVLMSLFLFFVYEFLHFVALNR